MQQPQTPLTNTEANLRSSLCSELEHAGLLFPSHPPSFSSKPNLLKQSFLSPDKEGMSRSTDQKAICHKCLIKESQHITDDRGEMRVSKIVACLLGVTEHETLQTSPQWVNHLKRLRTRGS